MDNDTETEHIQQNENEEIEQGNPSLHDDNNTEDGINEEIEEMKRRVKEMEEEAAKLSEMQAQVENQMGKSVHSTNSNGNTSGAVDQATLDENSVYVGQVDYESTPEELQALFQSCGTINRVTILCDRFTGQPKGYAYIEFASRDAVESAVLLNDTTFRGRQIKVTPKRQNVKGFNRGRARGGIRGGRGAMRGGGRRGGWRGGRGGRGMMRNYHPYY